MAAAPEPGSKANRLVFLEAVRRGRTDQVDQLLRARAYPEDVDENVLDWTGEPLRPTVLMLAAANAQQVCVERLLQSGAQVNGKNAIGRTALHIAAEKGHVPVAKRLLHANASLDIDDLKGNTPLHRSACNGRQEMTRVLLAMLAEVDIQDKRGQTALDQARDRGQTKICEMLAEAGAEKAAAWVQLRVMTPKQLQLVAKRVDLQDPAHDDLTTSLTQHFVARFRGRQTSELIQEAQAMRIKQDVLDEAMQEYDNRPKLGLIKLLVAQTAAATGYVAPPPLPPIQLGPIGASNKSPNSPTSPTSPYGRQESRQSPRLVRAA